MRNGPWKLIIQSDWPLKKWEPLALFNLDELSQARKQFVLAAKDDRSKKMAKDWIKYLDNEVARRESLQDGLG